MTRYLLDTNVISEPDRARPDPNVLAWFAATAEDATYLSALTLAELRKGVVKLGSRAAPRLATRIADLRVRFASRILPVDDPVWERWAQITGEAEAKHRRVPAFDALFAATALVHGLVLATRNVRDYARIGVPLLDPWERAPG